MDKPCKIVTKFLDKNGYPLVKIKGKVKRRARIVLEEKLGRPIQEGYKACHSCDTPGCIEPDHLWEGTQRQNVRDAWRKGRGKFERHRPPKVEAKSEGS
jgi:HNH endonuclease